MSNLKCLKCGKKVKEGEPYFTGYCAECNSKKPKSPESSESVESSRSLEDIKRDTKIMRSILIVLSVVFIGGGVGVSFFAVEQGSWSLWWASWSFVMGGLYMLIGAGIDRVHHKVNIEKIDVDYKISQMEDEIEHLKYEVENAKDEIKKARSDIETKIEEAKSDMEAKIEELGDE